MGTALPLPWSMSLAVDAGGSTAGTTSAALGPDDVRSDACPNGQTSLRSLSSSMKLCIHGWTRLLIVVVTMFPPSRTVVVMSGGTTAALGPEVVSVGLLVAAAHWPDDWAVAVADGAASGR